jgi:hypothetical protein
MADMNVEHLKMIQDVVKRMAGNSFLLKGWTVTLVSAIFAIAVKEADKGLDRRLMLIAWGPVLVFGLLDAYYLWQEQLFRKLYDHVRLAKTTDFSMNTAEIPHDKRPRFLRALRSVSIWPFYGALALVMGIITGQLLMT